MQSMLNVGNHNDGSTVKAVSDGIVDIFKAAHENHIDQSTIQAAVQAFTQSAEVKQIAITGNSFVSNPPKPAIEPDDEDDCDCDDDEPIF